MSVIKVSFKSKEQLHEKREGNSINYLPIISNFINYLQFYQLSTRVFDGRAIIAEITGAFEVLTVYRFSRLIDI